MPSPLMGVLPVLLTPFDSSGEIDFVALGNEVSWTLEQGVDGVVLGMVSESFRLSSEERDALADALCSFVDGRVSVTTSVGAESLHTAVRHAKAAQRAGVTAVMAIPPVGTACDDAQLFRYYAGILEATDVPVVVQDASGYLGRPLTIELQSRLFFEFGDRALFKPEATPIGPRLSMLRDATGGRAQIFEGTGGIALVDSFHRGIAGTMPGTDVVWAIVALWRALEQGDESRAAAIHGKLCPLIFLQTNVDSFVAVQRHLLARQVVLEPGEARGPLGFEMDPETRKEVERLFDLLRAEVDAGRDS